MLILHFCKTNEYNEIESVRNEEIMMCVFVRKEVYVLKLSVAADRFRVGLIL